MKLRYRSSTACLVPAIALALGGVASAATATKGTTAGANWSDTAAGVWTGGGGTNGAPASGDDVLIGSTSVNPTSTGIGGNLIWNKITIDRSTLVTFANSAGSTLSLGAGGITVNSTAAAGSGNSSVQLAAALSLVDQTWTIAATKGIVLNSANYTDGGTARTINVQGATAGTTTANFRVGGTGNGTVTNTGTWQSDSIINMKDLSYQLNGTSTNFSNSNTANSGALLTFDNVLFSTGNSGSARTLASSTKLLGNISTGAQTVPTGAGYNLIGTMDLGGATRTMTIGTQNAGTVNTLISGAISNGGLTKEGTGTLSLGGSNTYTGPTNINVGTLIAGHANAIANSAVNLGGGTLASSVNGMVTTTGTLSLSGGGISRIDLGGGTTVLSFADSSAADWTGSLQIINWTGNLDGGGSDQLIFASAGLDAAKISQVTFVNPNGISGTFGAQFVGNELVPVPEPTALMAVLATLGAALQRRRRA